MLAYDGSGMTVRRWRQTTDPLATRLSNTMTALTVAIRTVSPWRPIQPSTDHAALLAAYPDDEVIETVDRVLLPGFVNAHVHLYGALAHGIPVLQVGRTEEKADIGRRVEWAGAGLHLGHARPEPRQLRRALERLEEDRYRVAARGLAAHQLAHAGDLERGALDRLRHPQEVGLGAEAIADRLPDPFSVQDVDPDAGPEEAEAALVAGPWSWGWDSFGGSSALISPCRPPP